MKQMDYLFSPKSVAIIGASNNDDNGSAYIHVVPEPATMVFLTLSGIGMLIKRRGVGK